MVSKCCVRFFTVLACALVSSWAASTEAAEAKRPGKRAAKEPGGYKIIRHDPSRVQPGLTLVPTASKDNILLFDLDGNILHRWKIDATRARLLPDCRILVVHGSPFGKKKPKWNKLLSTIREYDFEGNVVWEYRAPRRAHHDAQRLANGNTLFIYRTPLRYNVTAKSFYEFSAEGEDQAEDDDGKRTKLKKTPENERRIHSDTLLEVSPEGEIVWQWDAHRHLDIHSCGRKPCKPIDDPIWREQPRDWTHTNTVTIIPENRWFDNGDMRFRPGNVMIMPRAWWQAFVIDKVSKRVMWEYGPNKKGGIMAPHEAHMIEKGLPGAGNVLIFDNGTRRERSHSIALEIDPVSMEIVWFYEDKENFYSSAQGSLQRLANGNTLLSEDVDGDILEVTPNKEIVWHFSSNKRLMRAHRYDASLCPQVQGKLPKA